MMICLNCPYSIYSRVTMNRYQHHGLHIAIFFKTLAPVPGTLSHSWLEEDVSSAQKWQAVGLDHLIHPHGYVFAVSEKPMAMAT